jgi:hypothetical protein
MRMEGEREREREMNHERCKEKERTKQSNLATKLVEQKERVT